MDSDYEIGKDCVKRKTMDNKDILNYLDSMASSLKKKDRILDSLLLLTKGQEMLLKEETLDGDAFDDLIEEKEKCVSELDLLDEGFESVYNLIKKDVSENPALYRVKVEEMQALIRKLVERGVEIEALERRNQVSLDNALAISRARIKQFKVNNEVATRYYSNMNAPVTGDSHFLDSKK